MSGLRPRIVTVSALAVMLAASGCGEVRGRRKIQAGNKLYKDGQYKDAVAAFEEAERLVPNNPILWLNKGYTCRQMMIPGAKTPENIAAAKCALTSFKRLQELAPNHPQAEALYIQTLFDADEFEALVKMFEERFKQNPRDIDSITGLIQTYSKWNKVEEALEWYAKKAEIQANDPEAQYGLGVFIWQSLAQKGGGPEKAQFDPRPDPNHPRVQKVPPPGSYGDIVGQQRVDLADTGLKYLEKAVALRPKYHEAMTYLNLLNRQKSFALFDQPAEWQKAVDQAGEWQKKSLALQGKAVPASIPQVAPNPDDAAPDEPAAAAPAGVEKPAAASKVASKGKTKRGSKGDSKKASHKGKRGRK